MQRGFFRETDLVAVFAAGKRTTRTEGGSNVCRQPYTGTAVGEPAGGVTR
jgi:hypothetical protein